MNLNPSLDPTALPPAGARRRSRGARLSGAVLVAAALLLSRCGSGLDGGVPGDPGDGDNVNHGRILGLRVTPGNEVLTVDLNREGRLTFTAALLFEDQTSRDVTARTVFGTSNAAAGRLDGPLFVAPARATTQVDFTTVTATFDLAGASYRALANLTVVWLRTSGGAQDFFFTLPYQSGAQRKPLSFSTLVQSIDSFFAVDTTSSMAPSILQLRDSLRTGIIPAVNAAAVKGAWFGVGAVEDFPVDPYGKAVVRAGQPDDQPFLLLSPMSADVAAAQSAVGNLLVGDQPRGQGGDFPEGQLEALYQIATGAGNQVAGVVDVPPHGSRGLGGVELRAGALPVITLITDAIFHSKGEAGRSCSATTTTGVNVSVPTEYGGAVASAAHSRGQATAALQKLCAKVIGVSTLRTTLAGYLPQPAGICSATADLTQLAVDTGALVPPVAWDLPARPAGCAAGKCCTGLGGTGEEPVGGLCPLVFKVAQDGTGLGAQVTSGITQVARFSRFDVVASTSGGTKGDKGEALPAGRTTADFLRSVLPLDATAPPAPPVIPAPVISGDHFTAVTPGSAVRFTIEAQNDFLMPTTQPQVFHATIRLRAGGCTDLDERDVLILVPPMAPPLG